MPYDDQLETWRREHGRSEIEALERQIVDLATQYESHMHATRQAALLLRIVYFLLGLMAGGAAVWFLTAHGAAS